MHCGPKCFYAAWYRDGATSIAPDPFAALHSESNVRNMT